MLGFQGPAQPSPALGDALNAGYFYLEVKCLGCNTHQTVALNIVRRPKTTPIHELERYMRCKDCSRLQGRPYKRSHLVALRPNKISTDDPPSTWWPGRAITNASNVAHGYNHAGRSRYSQGDYKDLGGTIVYLRQDFRTGGGVIAHLIVEGERAAIGGMLDLVIVGQLDGFTEFGPVATMATGNVAYRVAVPGDEVGILLVFAEVAPEVPTRVYPDTLGRIEGSVATGVG